MYAAALDQILTDPPKKAVNTITATVVAFRAIVPELDGFSEPEQWLLTEWLDRAISGGSRQPKSRA